MDLGLDSNVLFRRPSKSDGVLRMAIIGMFYQDGLTGGELFGSFYSGGEFGCRFFFGGAKLWELVDFLADDS